MAQNSSCLTHKGFQSLFEFPFWVYVHVRLCVLLCLLCMCVGIEVVWGLSVGGRKSSFFIWYSFVVLMGKAMIQKPH